MSKLKPRRQIKQPPYDIIVLIFNPKSTGDAPAKARQMRRLLKPAGVAKQVRVAASKYAGHAEVIAYKTAQKYVHPLIISVSGDGGYNEVINGILNAMADHVAKDPVCAVLAAGNANDHYHSVRTEPLETSILKHRKPQAIDVLQIEVKTKRDTKKRFAHSYIGFGMTSRIAKQLNKHDLNRWREVKLVLTAFQHHEPFAIVHNKKTMWLDSLVFANVHHMGKVLRLEKKSQLTNGRFDVIAFRHRSKLGLLGKFLATAIIGLSNHPQESKYRFQLLKTAPVQLDGELLTVESKAEITVVSVAQALKTL